MSSESVDRETIRGFDYVLLARDNPREMIARHLGQCYQLAIGICAFWAFLSNTLRVMRLLTVHQRLAVRWICFIQAASGTVFGATMASISLPGGAGCQIFVWICGPLMSLSTFLPLVVILQKVKVLMTTDYGCSADVPAYYPWLRLGLDLPINLLFSTAFLHVVISNYTRHRSMAWKELSRDGVMYMLFTAILNIVSAIVIASQLLKGYSQYVYTLEWYLSSYIIIAQQERAALGTRKEKAQYRSLHRKRSIVRRYWRQTTHLYGYVLRHSVGTINKMIPNGVHMEGWKLVAAGCICAFIHHMLIKAALPNALFG
ncbi:hypothetical protein THASP1DRAFT_24290 [Thamnocephalis sphaerospora]|uniref:Uncharacterized protein n=1 Tax=Thamnocephalis sphaerospora TaxID=78915 RepID=A0A4P9XQ42_9FUNG|nr:hypothetical protein THASP1DRAFT_24290 [Thamnocephalis sphaerospora]|eukprot:RKP07591.1 hypothetical protein THASP1DRAFT_24290 [Thamnocephalis sphaerospora]